MPVGPGAHVGVVHAGFVAAGVVVDGGEVTQGVFGLVQAAPGIKLVALLVALGVGEDHGAVVLVFKPGLGVAAGVGGGDAAPVVLGGVAGYAACGKWAGFGLLGDAAQGVDFVAGGGEVRLPMLWQITIKIVANYLIFILKSV